MIKQSEIQALSTAFPFWAQLSESQKNALIAGTRSTHFSKGQAMHCGEIDCLGVLLIRHGTVRIYITSEEGREVTLYRLDAGDICILSASCILQAITFDVSIDAESDCDVLQICPSVFSTLSAENVYVELFSYKLTTERFSDVMWVMQQILFISFDKRLATFLLDETARSKNNVLTITHEQIAKYLGSAREVVSRMLKYFSTEGYVTLSRGGITVTDRNRLLTLVETP